MRHSLYCRGYQLRPSRWYDESDRPAYRSWEILPTLGAGRSIERRCPISRATSDPPISITTTDQNTVSWGLGERLLVSGIDGSSGSASLLLRFVQERLRSYLRTRGPRNILRSPSSQTRRRPESGKQGRFETGSRGREPRSHSRAWR